MVPRCKVDSAEVGQKPFGSDNGWSVNYAERVGNIICAGCGVLFPPRRPSEVLSGRKRFCSRSCAARRNAQIKNALYPPIGEANPNFRGWASRRPIVYVRRFKAANPEKVIAQRVLATALRRGDLARPSNCSVCGTVCRPDGHHEDYTKPLEVAWVCRRCHRTKDAARRQREAA